MINAKAERRTPGTPFVPTGAERKRMEKNTNTFKSPHFAKACEQAGLPLTRRQASKWNNGKGKVYQS